MDDLIGKIEFNTMTRDDLTRTVSKLLSRVNKNSHIVACTCGRLKAGDEWTDLFLREGWKEATYHASFGVCPDCVRELYPDLAEELLKDISTKVRVDN